MPTQEPDSPRSHFTMIPDLIDELDLDPYTYRLYGHLRRVVGEPRHLPAGTRPEPGACWQSTRTLAAICHMSAGSICESKRKLVELGLIHIEKRPGPGGYYDRITLVDIWSRNSDHFAPSPAPPPGERSAESVQPPGGNSVRHVNASPSPSERSEESVHPPGSSVHQAKALRSPGETIHIPSKQISSSREKNEDDDEDEHDREREGNLNGNEKASSTDQDTTNLVLALFRAELRRDPTPLQREEIADLVALRADPAVWRHAFLRSVGARHRWAYVAQCIRNAHAAREDGPSTGAGEATDRRTPVDPGPRDTGGPGDTAKPIPPPAYVERWTRVLEALSWRLSESVYRQGFDGTTCIGARDGGKTWDVIVPRPTFLAWIQQPGHDIVVNKALRQCGFADVSVRFHPPPTSLQ
jgi:hypothetical protein